MRTLTFVMLALFGMIAIIGCRASGEIGETHSSIMALR